MITKECYRQRFFHECCTKHKGVPQIDLAPHNLFEWIWEGMTMGLPNNDDELIRLREFVADVAKGQQGELKGSFIIRIMNAAKKLKRLQEVQASVASKV